MAQPALNPKQLRFGLYELDLESRELRKSGIRIKLQDQPFLILSMLLERPGEIVTREELQNRLWPADTFVDFDLSLNSAVKKLRQALSDDSDNPRFIETLYRRGYRFIGSLNGSANGNAKMEAAELHPSEISELASLGPVPVLAFPAPPFAHKNRLILVVGGICALVVLAAAFWLVPQKPIRALGYTQITHDGRSKGPIVTDGERLYFQELDEDRFVIAQVSASGGETMILPTPFRNVGIQDISPDGNALLISDFKDSSPSSALWSLPLPAGPPRRVTDSLPDTATWSADAAEIAFAKGPEIYLAKADGTDARRLATAKGNVANLRFSPDGQRLRFRISELVTAVSQLQEVNRDGTGLHAILPDSLASPFDCCGTWTRDGKYFFFESSHTGAPNVWTLPEKRHWFSRTPQPVQLTNGPLQFSFPVPSKDGKKIFLVGSQPRAELLRIDPKLGMVPFLGNKSAIDLAFSPDGQWVAYVSMPDFTLWRSRVDGSLPLQLTPSNMYAQLPRWSPDGQQIVFMGRTNITNFRALVVSANAGDLHELIPGSEAGFDPNWSPDGKSVILTLNDNAFPSDMGISVFDLASKTISQLPGSGKFFSPRPSPDGKYIAAITKDSEKLVLFDIATQTWSDLTKPPVGPIGYPSWSHDGQYLYFDTTFTEGPAYFRVRASDRKVEEIASLKGVRRFRANFGPWSGLAPDDSPLVARDISSEEIYALDWDTP